MSAWANISQRDIWYAVSLSLVLLGVFLLFLGFFHFIIKPLRQRGRIAKRLDESGMEHLLKLQILKAQAEERAGLLQTIFRAVLRPQRYDRFRKDLLQADIYKNPSNVLAIVLLVAGFGFLVGQFLTKSPLIGLLIFLGIMIVPFGYVKWKKQRKTLAFERQMPDAMELLARSLRAGHTLPSAIELLGSEMDDPMATEMKITFEEQCFGIAMPEAMVHMLERVDSQDLRYFVSALLIQQDTGGNLAELMEKIAQVIRARLNFKVKVRALTAMGRMSAYIMIVTPIIAFLLLNLVARYYVSALYTTPMGRKMLTAGIIFLIIGSLTLRRLINSVEAG